MRKFKISLVIGLAVFTIYSCKQQQVKEAVSTVNTDTVKVSEQPVINTPEEALAELKAGNLRFVNGEHKNYDYKKQMELTKEKQTPHSVVLSCMDSRVPPEILFDQGIGSIFVCRVAGNVEDKNVMGSIEYGVEHAGAKLVLVMGHSHCGAVTGAVKDIKLGNLTQLLDQIKPAIITDKNNPNVVDETAKNNIKQTIKDIIAGSEVVRKMIEEKKVAVKGAFYDIETGAVTFIN
jgi:carbonic anhydrase